MDAREKEREKLEEKSSDLCSCKDIHSASGGNSSRIRVEECRRGEIEMAKVRHTHSGRTVCANNIDSSVAAAAAAAEAAEVYTTTTTDGGDDEWLG